MGDVAIVCSLVDNVAGVVKNSPVPETNSVGETVVPGGRVAAVSLKPACCSVWIIDFSERSSGNPPPPVTGFCVPGGVYLAASL